MLRRALVEARRRGRARWTGVLIVTAVAALSGCSPAPLEDDADELPARVEPERCVLPEQDSVEPRARQLSLGEGSADAFAAYVDGVELPLLLGWQGGYMITPRVRVEALDGDPESACWRVRLSNHVEQGWVGPGMVAHLEFVREGDAFYSDPVNDLLTYQADELSGQALRLDVSAEGIDVDEQLSVTVMLMPPE